MPQGFALLWHRLIRGRLSDARDVTAHEHGLAKQGLAPLLSTCRCLLGDYKHVPRHTIVAPIGTSNTELAGTQTQVSVYRSGIVFENNCTQVSISYMGLLAAHDLHAVLTLDMPYGYAKVTGI